MVKHGQCIDVGIAVVAGFPSGLGDGGQATDSAPLLRVCRQSFVRGGVV